MKMYLTISLMFLVSSVAFAGQNVMVILDDSGSMGDKMKSVVKMEAAKDALMVVLKELPKDSRVGILSLNHGWIQAIGPIGSDMYDKISAIQAGGSTPLGEQLEVASNEMLADRKKTHELLYRLIVITDGEASDVGVMEKNWADVQTKNFLLDVIGVKMQGDHSMAKKAHSYRRADDKESLNAAMKQIFAETTIATDGDASVYESIPEEVILKVAEAVSMGGGSTNEKVEKSDRVVEQPIKEIEKTPVSFGMIILLVTGFIFVVVVIIALIGWLKGEY